MIGPGKYDDVCTQVRVLTEADGAMVIILRGNRGSGFSCQFDSSLSPKASKLLREVADQLEEDLKTLEGGKP